MPGQPLLEQTESTATGTTRLHYVDWLRVLAILGVFLFHVTNVFNDADFHIKNAETSSAITIVQAFFFPWGMPLFFLIAGGSTWFALKRRTSGQYIRERTNRLFIPFVVGSVLLSPLELYLEWSHKTQTSVFDGSFTQFLGTLPWGPNPRIFGVVGYHLWFLGFLFVFALLTLPLFRWLQGESGQRFVSWLARVCRVRGGILVFMLLPLVARLALQPFFPQQHNWADFFSLLSFFVIGYVVVSEEQLRQAVRRDWPVTLVTGAVAFGTGVAIVFSTGELDIEAVPHTLLDYVWWGSLVVCGWCWTCVAFSFGMRFLSFSNRLLRYGQESIVPFFVVHQPVIIAVSYYVVQWNMNLWLKLAVVGIGSFAISLGLYQFVIRRVGILRTAFGMKAS